MLLRGGLRACLTCVFVFSHIAPVRTECRKRVCGHGVVRQKIFTPKTHFSTVVVSLSERDYVTTLDTPAPLRTALLPPPAAPAASRVPPGRGPGVHVHDPPDRTRCAVAQNRPISSVISSPLSA